MKERSDFGIKIDYQRGTENPERVFRAMTDLLESMKMIDQQLVKSIDSRIEPVMMLEDVETGSIIVWLRNLLEAAADDALKNLDWKPQVGKYLVKAKYALLNFMDKRIEISDKEELFALQKEIHDLAEETDVRQFPAYAPVTMPDLIGSVDSISSSLKHLKEQDKVYLLSAGDGQGEQQEQQPFNLSFDIVPEDVESLVTKEEIINEITQTLQVKKPDYLGESMWEFRHTKNFSAKILDEEWLKKFQNRKVDIRPGDSIKAKLKVKVKYGFDNKVISETYDIIEVLAVLPKPGIDQTSLDTNA